MDVSKIIPFLLFYPGLLFSFSFHESAHGWVANKLGDDTAKRLGRITLNPLPHMSFLGTFLLPILGFFTAGFVIGWGVPVPVDYRNFKSLKRDILLVALAGPVSNLFLALILAGLLHGLAFFFPAWLDPHLNTDGVIFVEAVVQIFILNLALAFFNLIPIHPLDGGKVMYGLLPQALAQSFDRFMARYGFLLLLIFLASGAFRFLVEYPVRFMANLLL